jgi:predicted dehydrogenase
MATLHRREFLEHSKKAGLGLAAGLTILADARSARSYAANEKLTLALIGAGGRAGGLGPNFAERGDCQFAYVCDVNMKSAEGLSKKIEDVQKKPPKPLQDFRKMLDDKSVQAVVIATPDHWHALATIWSCQAGKDVYVEKPPTHNCWEGKQMIAAAKKYQRVVQVGTQCRSAAYAMSAKKYLADGKLGNVYFARIMNQKSWPNVPMAADSDTPAGLDWDMWSGPAPMGKYNPTLHRRWNHFWRYSSGDIINDAIHQIDLARWVLGVEIPKSVYCSGARYEKNGAFETPDTQMVIYDFDNMTVNFELTLFTPYMLKIAPNIRESLTEYPYWPQCATRTEIYGTKGLMILGRHGGGWQVFDRPYHEQAVVKDQDNGKFPDPEHKENFVRAVRRQEPPNAPIEEGHKSVLMAHYATISYRLGGQKLVIDPKTEEVTGNPEAMKYFKREYRKPWVIEETV